MCRCPRSRPSVCFQTWSQLLVCAECEINLRGESELPQSPREKPAEDGLVRMSLHSSFRACKGVGWRIGCVTFLMALVEVHTCSKLVSYKHAGTRFFPKSSCLSDSNDPPGVFYRCDGTPCAQLSPKGVFHCRKTTLRFYSFHTFLVTFYSSTSLRPSYTFIYMCYVRFCVLSLSACIMS